MNSLGKCMLMGAALAMNACSEPEELSFGKISGLQDRIPYEALGSGKLAFSRDGEFFLIDADAKTSWGLKGVPYDGVISPDGKYIAYANHGSVVTTLEIFVYDIENNKVTQVSQSEWSEEPAWTADSKYVLYEVYTPSEHALYRRELTKASTSIVITLGPADFLTSISASIHDELVFLLSTTGASEEMISGIFTINQDGTGLIQIASDTTMSNIQLSPAWSPNGDFIAYIKYRRDDAQSIHETQITVMNKDGSNASTLATFPVVEGHYILYDTNPSIVWSPDGTRLAFNVFEADGTYIYVINADGSGLKKITSRLGAKDDHLSWSK